MKCPTCVETTLVMADKQGIEIDYCPDCRGVWLDRGELDKIIERSIGAHPGSPDRAIGEMRGRNDDPRGDHKSRKHKKKRGGALDFLGDIFEFGD